MLNKRIHPDINSGMLSASHENNAYTNPSIPQLAEKDKTNLLLNVQSSSIPSDSDHVNSCTAARTRSVQQWQKRKLFNLLKIEKSSPSMICGCGDSWTPCVLCKRSSPNLPRLTQRQDLRDRVALMDLSFHPVLSFETGKRKIYIVLSISLHEKLQIIRSNVRRKYFEFDLRIFKKKIDEFCVQIIPEEKM